MKYTLLVVALCLFATHCLAQSKKSNDFVPTKSSSEVADTEFHFYEVWQLIEKKGSPHRFYRASQHDTTTEYVWQYNENITLSTMKFGGEDGLLLCPKNEFDDLVLMRNGRAFYINRSTHSLREEEDTYGVKQLFMLAVQIADE